MTPAVRVVGEGVAAAFAGVMVAVAQVARSIVDLGAIDTVATGAATIGGVWIVLRIIWRYQRTAVEAMASDMERLRARIHELEEHIRELESRR